MRRKVNWAVVGTTGVLAAIVATTLVSQHDSGPRSARITVPQASGGADGSRPGDGKSQAPTVFIPIVPPVAVTSASSAIQTPAQPPVAQPAPEAPVRQPVEQVVAPKKNPPASQPPGGAVPPKTTTPPRTATPRPTQGPSYWDLFAYYAGRAYEYYRDEYGDDDYRSGYGGSRHGGYHR